MSKEAVTANIPSEKCADYQIVAKVVLHAKFGKMWQFSTGGGLLLEGHQYALRNRGLFLSADSYAVNTKVYLNPITNNFDIETVAGEANPQLVGIRAYDVSIGKYWNIVDESLRKLFVGYQFVVKVGHDSFDAYNYKEGKQLVLHKMTGSPCVVDESFKISMQQDDKYSRSSFVAGGVGALSATIDEQDLPRLMVCHVEGTNTPEFYNPEEIAVTVKLVKQLLLEGTAASSICVTSPVKAQLAVLQKRLSRALSEENIFFIGDTTAKVGECTIVSVAINQGKAINLGHLSKNLPRLLKQSSQNLFLVCDANYLYTVSKLFESALTFVEENGQFIDPEELT